MSAKTKPYEEKMSSACKHLEKELQAIRAGRANPAVLDKVAVEYYGTPTPVAQLAAVAVPEARVLTISPWDTKLVKEISKAIMSSDIGINPIDDGRVIRLNFPAPTEERRKQLTKDVSKLGEESKVAIRSIRRDAIEQIKKAQKDSEITEDDRKKLEDQAQKLTDSHIKDIDKIVSDKQKEIMEV